MKKKINTRLAPSPVGPYSQAIEYHQMLFVSGQIPINPETSKIEAETIEAQTVQVLENIKAILLKADSSFEKVLKVEIFLLDMNDFATVNKIYAEYFDIAPQPARQAIEVSRLPLDVKIEISCIASK